MIEIILGLFVILSLYAFVSLLHAIGLDLFGIILFFLIMVIPISALLFLLKIIGETFIRGAK